MPELKTQKEKSREYLEWYCKRFRKSANELSHKIQEFYEDEGEDFSPLSEEKFISFKLKVVTSLCASVINSLFFTFFEGETSDEDATYILKDPRLVYIRTIDIIFREVDMQLEKSIENYGSKLKFSEMIEILKGMGQ